MPTVTPDDCLGFWSFMTAHFCTKLIDKAEALEMVGGAKLLEALGILDAEDFMSRFSTTLDDRIYVPFKIGVPGPDGHFTLWSQIKICAHEHQHVSQARKSGLLPFAVRYGTSTGDRALYEGEAYRVNMELEHWRGGYPMLQYGRALKSLESYGLGEDLAVARSYLTCALVTVQAGGVSTRAGKLAIKWLNEYAPHIRQ